MGVGPAPCPPEEGSEGKAVPEEDKEAEPYDGPQEAEPPGEPTAAPEEEEGGRQEEALEPHDHQESQEVAVALARGHGGPSGAAGIKTWPPTDAA